MNLEQNPFENNVEQGGEKMKKAKKAIENALARFNEKQ